MRAKAERKLPLLVLGGAKSGKSAHAEAILQGFPPPYVYLATAQIFDEEMRERVSIHMARRGNNWETIECPIELPEALENLRNGCRPVLLDCITLWLSNLLCFSSKPPEDAITRLCNAVRAASHPLVIVSNEVGGGIVPENALARKYRDLAGWTNQRLASECGSVELVVAGLPLRLK